MDASNSSWPLLLPQRKSNEEHDDSSTREVLAVPTLIRSLSNDPPAALGKQNIPVAYEYRPGRDVLSGRSERIKKNNVFYRLKVHESFALYNYCEENDDKRQVAHMIVEAVHSRGGRFLDLKGNPLTDRKATKKTMKALKDLRKTHGRTAPGYMHPCFKKMSDVNMSFHDNAVVAMELLEIEGLPSGTTMEATVPACSTEGDSATALGRTFFDPFKGVSHTKGSTSVAPSDATTEVNSMSSASEGESDEDLTTLAGEIFDLSPEEDFPTVHKSSAMGESGLYEPFSLEDHVCFPGSEAESLALDEMLKL